MTRRRPILLTGFEPFGPEKTNPSAAIVDRLVGRTIAGHPVVGETLPVVFGESRRRLEALLEEHRPHLVVCLGVAGNRRAISLERVAINVADASIPDNAGVQPRDLAVERGGPTAYWSSLPLRVMEAALRGAEVPVELSSTAGTYVCNQLFYGLMHVLRQRRGVRGGFVHVPRARRGLSAARMAAAVEIALAAAVATKTSGRGQRQR